MAPPSATSNGNESQAGTATLEPGLDKSQAAKKEITMPKFPGPKKFEDKYEERDYQKGRLALAFRIFAKFGFDEGVAGHITLRVSVPEKVFQRSIESIWRLLPTKISYTGFHKQCRHELTQHY